MGGEGERGEKIDVISQKESVIDGVLVVFRYFIHREKDSLIDRKMDLDTQREREREGGRERKREREGERERGRQTDRQTDRQIKSEERRPEEVREYVRKVKPHGPCWYDGPAVS